MSRKCGAYRRKMKEMRERLARVEGRIQSSVQKAAPSADARGSVPFELNVAGRMVAKEYKTGIALVDTVIANRRIGNVLRTEKVVTLTSAKKPNRTPYGEFALHGPRVVHNCTGTGSKVSHGSGMPRAAKDIERLPEVSHKREFMVNPDTLRMYGFLAYDKRTENLEVAKVTRMFESGEITL